MALTTLPAVPIRHVLQLRKEIPLGSSLIHSPAVSSSCRRRGSTTLVITCGATKPRYIAAPKPASLIKEAHKYFDHAMINVRSGDGGHGAVLTMPSESDSGSKDKKKKRSFTSSFKREPDGSLILPMGGHGGDVIIFADENLDSLLEFHNKSRYCAKRGGNVDTMSALNSQMRGAFPAPSLRIPVPVGTVVKRKKGKVLADLANPGDEIIVVRGGQGGISLLEMPPKQKKKIMSLSNNVMRDPSDKVLVLGQPGQEISLELILRVVADVGLVGLPNAGKSTLLASLTFAKPDIADYPFTTLMPNLGRLDGDPSLGALQFSTEATLADLPGLIEGAHLGKGLGRNFLRHLRRTRLLVHVVDAAAPDPVNDYRTVREELRMYNPTYLERPYIVVLNKIDVPEMDRYPYNPLTYESTSFFGIHDITKTTGAYGKLPSLIQEISAIGLSDSSNFDIRADTQVENSEHDEKKEKELEDYPRPLAVVGTSFMERVGIDELLKEIRAGLSKCTDLTKLMGQEVTPTSQ